MQARFDVRTGALRALLLAAIMVFANAVIGSASAEEVRQQVAPPPPPGKALIYLYRAPVFAGALFPAHFAVDNVDVAKLSNKDYTWFYAPASAHLFGYKKPVIALTLADDLHGQPMLIVDWQEGNTYYYRFQWEVGPCGVPSCIAIGAVTRQVGPEEANRELALFKYKPSYNTDRLKANPAGPGAATMPSSSAAPSPPSSGAPAAAEPATR
jgi:hypothetical protein